MDEPLLVYTTLPDLARARQIGRALVERKLAACVNHMPGMTSIYAWQGAVEEASEVVAIIKTRQDRAEEVRAALRALHPYETPIILFIPTQGGDAGTIAWLVAETTDGAGG